MLLTACNYYRQVTAIEAVILTTSLWYSNIVKMQTYRKWHDKDVMDIGYFLNGIHYI